MLSLLLATSALSARALRTPVVARRGGALASTPRRGGALAATQLHVEYCERWNYGPRVEKLREFLGDGYEISANDPAVLAWSSPTQEWRIGAFEVTNLESKALLYSKLERARGVLRRSSREKSVETRRRASEWKPPRYGRHLVDNEETFKNWAAETFGA